MIAVQKTQHSISRFALQSVFGRQVRHHISHGGSPLLKVTPQNGPRDFVPIGLEAAQCNNNILRLLESSHGWASSALDTSYTSWHPRGLIWRHTEDLGWTANLAHSDLDLRMSTSGRPSNVVTPRLLSISLLDDRTSLVKIIGSDGTKRYLNLLRFDPDIRNSSNVSNDGWLILREVVVPSETTSSKDPFGSLHQTIQTYLDVEHGGGSISRAKAEDIFSPNASLIAVGNLPHDEEPTTWTAPTGSLLEIPLSAYLEGVDTQHPHAPTCRTHDAILSLDVSGLAAVATVRVGNGAQTQVFDDILLLGRKEDKDEESSGGWCILSKIFSTKNWPR